MGSLRTDLQPMDRLKSFSEDSLLLIAYFEMILKAVVRQVQEGGGIG
jgi:hypothetical protein